MAEKKKFDPKEIEKLVSLLEKRKTKKKKNEHYENHFKISKTGETKYEKFNVINKTYSLSVTRQANISFIGFIQSLTVVFNYLLNVALSSIDDENDYVRFIFSRAPRSYFSTPLIKFKELDVAYFINIFEKHMQSNRQLISNGWESEVIIQIVSNDKMASRRKKKNKQINKKKMYRNLNKAKKDESGDGNKYIEKYGRKMRTGVFYVACTLMKKCCFVISLLIGVIFLNDNITRKKILRYPSHNVDGFITTNEICNVYEKCGVPVGTVKVLDYTTFYKNFLKELGIDLVVYSEQYDDTIIYDSRTDENGDLIRLTNKIVCLWLNNNHYDVVMNMCEFSKLNPTQFCVKCMTHFIHGENQDNHVCKIKLTCQRCYKLSDCVKNCKIECSSCNILFYNNDCFTNHLFNKVFKGNQSNYTLLTPCQYFFYCKTCLKIAPRFTLDKKNKTKNHKCNEIYCAHCEKNYKQGHLCYMKPIKSSQIKNENSTLFFFDFETKLDENKLMVPFYCVVQKVCKKCENIIFKKDEDVICCGKREFVFEKNGESIVKEMCEFMLEQTDSTWIAHNGGRFDTIFIFKFLLEEKNIIPETVLNGNKIMTLFLQNKNIRFFDSYMFLNMPLAAMPSAMGLENACKGFHPYHFYDLNYVGEIVAKKYFDVSSMSVEKKKEFEKWYVEKQKNEYIFKNEIYYYCSEDVNILRLSCIKFSSMLSDVSNVEPFYDPTMMTIASVALKVFRKNFLRKNCVGVLPASGYRGKINQSLIALLWLHDLNSQLNGRLEYKCSRHGEKKILGRHVDGYDESTNTVYQFHGCFFHGCQECYHPYDKNKLTNEKFIHLYDATQKFTWELRNAGYNVIEKWECIFKKEVKITDTILKEKKCDFYAYVPLNPRDSLYGGRTSSVCLFKTTILLQKIRYIDFTSLYPDVQKNEQFPIGHPEIYLNEECNNVEIENVFGLIKCDILPPRNLYFPVLPVHVNGKLLFPLCNECAKMCNSDCDHNDTKRCLHGTWTTPEVKKAIEKGYIIMKTHEIYNYVKQGSIFIDYVNCFLKIKQEASGIPQACDNETKVDMFCKNYLKHEGIQLEKKNIKKNPGLRTIAKLLLNSLWGKFAQNEKKTKVEFVNDYEELLFLANDSNVKITSLDFVNEQLLRCTYVEKDCIVKPLKNTNVVIAAFVTSYARIKLYNLIDKLQKKVLYFDTDSVIYVCDNENDQVKTGDYLGELTNELSENEWITQFCSTGPKSYAYITNKNKEHICVKGFSLKNEKLKEQLNFKSVSRCVKDKNQIIEIAYNNKICRDKLNNVFVEDEIKQFSFTFNKRVVKNDFYTVPYGYLDE